jgi:hypothetical protein
MNNSNSQSNTNRFRKLKPHQVKQEPVETLYWNLAESALRKYRASLEKNNSNQEDIVPDKIGSKK